MINPKILARLKFILPAGYDPTKHFLVQSIREIESWRTQKIIPAGTVMYVDKYYKEQKSTILQKKITIYLSFSDYPESFYHKPDLVE